MEMFFLPIEDIQGSIAFTVQNGGHEGQEHQGQHQVEIFGLFSAEIFQRKGHHKNSHLREIQQHTRHTHTLHENHAKYHSHEPYIVHDGHRRVLEIGLYLVAVADNHQVDNHADDEAQT